MYHQMTNKIIFLLESLDAMPAFVWFHPSFCPHMDTRWLLYEKPLLHWLHWYIFSPLCILRWLLKTFFFWEILVTLTALVWFISCVYLHMCYENTLIWSKEPYHTGILIWLLPSMYQQMFMIPVMLKPYHFDDIGMVFPLYVSS